MNVVTVPFVLPSVAFAALWTLLAVAVCALHVPMRRRFTLLDAEQRAGLLLALALLPVVCAAGAAVLAFAPAIGGFVVDAHCHADVGCSAHVPTLRTDASLAALLVLIAAAVFVAIGRSASNGLRRSLSVARALALLDTQSGQPERRSNDAVPIEIAESRERFAYCAGLVRPRVVVSSALFDALPALEREAVLAHERAHAARRDNLRALLAGIALWPVPRALKRGLLRDLAAAAELACDRRAANQIGGTAAVAAALAAAHALPGAPETHGRRAPRTARSAWSRADGWAVAVRERLAALDAAPGRHLPAAVAAMLVTAVYVAVTLTATLAAHHGTELVIAGLG